MFTEENLRQALRDCYDPALRRDIVSLGRIQSATLTRAPTAPGATIPGAEPRFFARVAISADDPESEAAAMLGAQVSNRLAGIREISASEVIIVRSPFPILR